jgi:hypothetical protein
MSLGASNGSSSGKKSMMRLARRGLGLPLAALIACGPASPASTLKPVTLDQLCVTEGQVTAAPGGLLAVDDPKMRAIVPASDGQSAQARFTYLGPTASTVALGSGASREQFGLKLRAADPCNLVYAMWRFAPTPGVVVQVKSNPGEHDSSACQNGGYTTISPSRAAPVAAPAPGAAHQLAAAITGQTLTVQVDGATVWEGDLGAAALADAGPVGIRSDNARLTLALLAAPAASANAPCKAGSED